MRKVVTGVVASAALLGAAVIAPAAHAAPCDGVGMQQPFLPWHDQASYVLVDGGDFETAAAGWTLGGAAATTAGGNTLRPESSATSLALPEGSSATSPSVCVAKGNPTARIFSRSASAAKSAKSRIKVDVLYLNDDGSVRKVKKAGKLKARSEWAPTRKFSLAQGQFVKPKAPGGVAGAPADKPDKPEGDKPAGGGSVKTTHIALRFTAVKGDVLIDDVFVDPRMRR